MWAGTSQVAKIWEGDSTFQVADLNTQGKREELLPDESTIQKSLF